MILDDAKLREDTFALQLWLSRRYGPDFDFLILECYANEIVNVVCVATAASAQTEAEQILAALGWKLNLHEGPSVLDMITAHGTVSREEEILMIERVDSAYISTLSAHELIDYIRHKNINRL
tara:strand:- start:1487 stop:1852 length:366 start_codon:yes stop_codon:yes gene_type:complete